MTKLTHKPSASRTDPCADCVTDFKNALPILPVRYAIARSDMGSAPALPKTFEEHIRPIGLPAGTAHYTLRLLRPGYLYMFDEAFKEWTGYVVDEYSYLDEFDVYAKSPPAVEGVLFSDACKTHHPHCRARCIAVRDAAYATRIWLCFSNVFWTRAVLEKHGTPEYREAHMQCLDVAAWRDGIWQPRTAKFDALNHVAEFSANGLALRDETYEYVRRYLPPPYRLPEELLKDDAKTQKAVSLTSPLFTRLLQDAVRAPVKSGPMTSAAWAFSPQPFFLAQDEAAGLAQWETQAAKTGRAAMVGLADPAGIAMELNGLVLQRSVEFTDEPQRKSKYETALTISALREAVKNHAVKRKSEERQQLEELTGGAYEPDAMTFGILRDWMVQQHNLEPEGALSDAEQQAIRDAIWAKYSRYFKSDEWESYLGERTETGTKGTSYYAALEDFSVTTLGPLDAPYLAWLKSDAMLKYFSRNFDPFHFSSGQAYSDLATVLIKDAGDRSQVFDYLQSGLMQDPNDPNAWLIRALALNHEPLIRGWTDKALEAATTPNPSWLDLAEKFHDKFKEVITEGAHAEEKLDSVARYIYQLTGPLIVNLSKALNAPLAKGVEKILSVDWQMGMLGVVARVGNPNLKIVDLRGEWTRQQATRTLTNLLGKLSGTYAAEYRTAARSTLDEFAKTNEERFPFRAVMLVDKAKAERLEELTGAARRAAAADVLTAAQFDEIFQDSVGKLGNLNVKAGVVQMLLSGITTAMSFREVIKAKPDEVRTKEMNLAAGAASLFGGMMETVGSSLKKTAWGTTPVARQFKFFTLELLEKADRFILTGKVLGVLGNGMAGFLQIIEARDMSENHSMLRRLTLLNGYFSIGLAAMMFFVRGIPGVSLFIGVVLAVVTFVVGWIKPDPLQSWLEQSLHFGRGQRLFDGPVPQDMALESMVRGD